MIRFAILTCIALVILPTTVRAEDVKVTVVAILASDRHKTIDSKLTAIADEVRKRDQSLQSMTGWKIERTTVKSLSLDKKESFPLVGDVSAEITVLSKDDKDKKTKVLIKCPHFGEVTYSTVSDKFFPAVTRYQTEPNKERLIFAVMVKPLPPKDKDKEKDKQKAPEKPG
jgi:hypothetical protein